VAACTPQSPMSRHAARWPRVACGCRDHHRLLLIIKGLSTAMVSPPRTTWCTASPGARVALGFVASSSPSCSSSACVATWRGRTGSPSSWSGLRHHGGDVLHVGFGVPYFVSTTFYAIVLVAVFFAWDRVEDTLSSTASRARRELFYWAAVVATFALAPRSVTSRPRRCIWLLQIDGALRRHHRRPAIGTGGSTGTGLQLLGGVRHHPPARRVLRRLAGQARVVGGLAGQRQVSLGLTVLIIASSPISPSRASTCPAPETRPLRLSWPRASAETESSGPASSNP